MTLRGILNIDKPRGMTSRRAVDRVQQLLPPVKIGHSGTLDPLATGVLLVCVGNATRLVPYMHRASKTYRADFRFGWKSDTDDAEGHAEACEMARPTRDDVLAALPAFHGLMQQVPPQYSAVHVAGRRAYQLARENKPVLLEPKSVVIHRLELLSYAYPDLQLEIECSTGTYVRSLGRDLAAALGTVAILTDLVRTASGPFQLADAVPLDELDVTSVMQHLQPLRSGLRDWDWVTLNDEQTTRAFNGQHIELSAPDDTCHELAAADQDGRLVAILVRSGAATWKPDRCFK